MRIAGFAPVHRQVVHADMMGWDNSIVDSLRRILDGHSASLAKAIEMGVEILVGSDAGSYGVPHAIGLFEEIWLLSQAGMPSIEVLSRVIHDNLARLTPSMPHAAISAGAAASLLLALPVAREDARLLASATVVLHGSPISQAGAFELL